MFLMGNAAGWLKRPADLDDILKVPSDIVSFVTLGSYTPLKRDGNPGSTFDENVNALGLPNPGLVEGGAASIGEMIKRIRDSGKSPRVSIAGFSPEDYAIGMAMTLPLMPDEIEINLGCPNVWQGHQQKPIASFKPELIQNILNEVRHVLDEAKAPRIAVKVSPYSDPALLEIVATILHFHNSFVTSVVTCNTFPNAFKLNAQKKPALTNRYGGLSGKKLKEIALGQALMFRENLPERMEVVLVGGIDSGDDVRDAELVGASSVQVGTAFFLQGAAIFQRIAEEYVAKYVS